MTGPHLLEIGKQSGGLGLHQLLVCGGGDEDFCRVDGGVLSVGQAALPLTEFLQTH